MIKRILVFFLAVPIIVGGVYASYCGLIIWAGNFHTVEEGELYRSAQLSKELFEKMIERHKIKTIINLRGSKPKSLWYQDEVAVAGEYGVQHYDIGISARRLVPIEKVEEIVRILRTAPRPILVHCASGSDRTGFVAALFRYVVEGLPAEKARAELSLWYGHFPYFTSETGAMDLAAENYFVNHPPTIGECDNDYCLGSAASSSRQ